MGNCLDRSQSEDEDELPIETGGNSNSDFVGDSNVNLTVDSQQQVSHRR